MTYTELKNKVQENKNLIGEPLGNADVQHLVISTHRDLENVMRIYYSNDFNNEAALIQLGLINNDNLLIFLFPPKYMGFGVYAELEKYLSDMKL